MQNIEDVKGCDVMLFLPDDGRGEAQNTPGKFVEMGIALAMGKPIVRVKGRRPLGLRRSIRSARGSRDR